ncbi:MAG: rhodanese-like domain-containing protein [Reyranellaceae bacterium]
MSAIKFITPEALKAWLKAPSEFALLDVREEGEFSEAHLLLASCLPLSHLELQLERLVPRRAVRLALIDADGAEDGLACRAARLLMAHGYGDVHVVAGGIDAWSKAGFELFSGVNVPSKAFGEIVEHQDHTPSIAAEELQAMLAAGKKPVILDSRTYGEYVQVTIPGAISCPGAELVHRFRQIVHDPDQLVVVNCAGRTRSIIGAQSLISAGVPNKVVALRNGVMGWRLAGLTVENGARRAVDAPEVAPDSRPQFAADALRSAMGVREASAADIAALRADPSRTTYLLDVRDPAEYRQGHLAGSDNAPGGQLVQATDTYMATRNARVVLVDDTGTRAGMTAWWLARMGWPEVFVHRLESSSPLVPGEAPARILGGLPPAARTISADALAASLPDGRTVVLDLADSIAYKRGHIPGAWFIVRARLAADLKRVTLPANAMLVATSPDGVLARLAAGEIEALAGRPVFVLEGGTASWTAQNRDLEPGHTNMASQPTDVWYRPSDRPSGVEAAMQEYLSWEIGLVDRVIRDGDAPFLKLLGEAR